MEGAEEFFRVYSQLPLEERKNVIAVLDDEPISWILAYQLIKNNTEKGQKVLKILKELNII